ncbi:hypothetical protein [Streptomyces clavuligerus]|uniref:Uncharacterized protein n=1 Tax=Streptomyces clavuligerus TaxID=1901 RepID=B5GW13_STRCL|nr:hypothetical protein [Streptomyces clavuligerus]EDY50510.1 hypothetical protein SSCG_03656 [Streptomyces clavuligerus]EFG03585.1 Hypothetical protein SCLAV_p0094 [Streptomyces clavuligerus]MBY6307838.1 hypothetical protein [Streptomyces clavuligerus]WDN56330.1 hypothetical protein LL058_31215 [Streptomyces clavuligerus]
MLQPADALTASTSTGWIVGHISAYRTPWSGRTPTVGLITTHTSHLRHVNDLTTALA